jgi:hypothetical protein
MLLDFRGCILSHVMARAAAFIILLVFAGAYGLSADEWPRPRVRVVASDNGLRFVRIIPGTHQPEALEPAPGQRNAEGEFYARAAESSYKLIARIALQNPLSPVDARLTDDGYLVTFDNWGAIGKGHVITFYKPDGQLLRNVRLDELYRNVRLVDPLPFSKSSIRWRCGVSMWAGIGPGIGDFIQVEATYGGYFKLTPETGEFTHIDGPRLSSCSASTFRQ